MRVVVDFNHRPIVGFVIGLSQTSSFSTKPILYTLINPNIEICLVPGFHLWSKA